MSELGFIHFRYRVGSGGRLKLANSRSARYSDSGDPSVAGTSLLHGLTPRVEVIPGGERRPAADTVAHVPDGDRRLPGLRVLYRHLLVRNARRTVPEVEPAATRGESGHLLQLNVDLRRSDIGSLDPDARGPSQGPRLVGGDASRHLSTYRLILTMCIPHAAPHSINVSLPWARRIVRDWRRRGSQFLDAPVLHLDCAT